MTMSTSTSSGSWERVRFSGPALRPAPYATEAAHPPALPDPEQWSGQLARACVEALTASRPASQLIRWLSAELYEAVSRRAGLMARVHGAQPRRRHARVLSIDAQEVRPGVVESTVVVHDGARVRAVAMRLEAHHGRWRATALDVG